MNRFALPSCLFLACFALQAATSPPLAKDLLLEDKTAFALTAGFSEYEVLPSLKGKLTSVGSGVVTILINRWTSDFATLYPEVVLDIEGGGSVDGMTRLLEGRAEIVPMSRVPRADEIARFRQKFGYEPAQVVVAQDAVGIYVNKSNPIAGLTPPQLEAIYSRVPKPGSKRPEFWGDLGITGPLANERIMRMSLSQVHGSQMFFRDEILHGAEYRFDVRFEAVPGSLVQAVGADDAGIGFASVIFATARTRFVPLQAADGRYLLPSYENTVSGQYPLVRPMRIVFHRKPDGSINPVAREFLRFAVSRRGQRIISLAESYPLTRDQQQAALRAIGETPAAKPKPK